MMPNCSYKNCTHVADTTLGVIEVGKVTGALDGYDKPWTETVYVCSKHLKKIVNSLGFKETKS